MGPLYRVISSYIELYRGPSIKSSAHHPADLEYVQHDDSRSRWTSLKEGGPGEAGKVDELERGRARGGGERAPEALRSRFQFIHIVGDSR